MKHKAFTLTELMLALILVVTALVGVFGASVFFLRQVQAFLERSDCQAQISFAMEDMSLHFLSAIQIEDGTDQTLFPANTPRQALQIEGEADVFQVTPGDLSDNAQHTFQILNGALVRLTSGAATEVLIDARFHPTIRFEYVHGTQPNVLSVKIEALTKTAPLGRDRKVERTEAMRFWFIRIAR